MNAPENKPETAPTSHGSASEITATDLQWDNPDTRYYDTFNTYEDGSCELAWCSRCHNTGYIECLCGGDNCACENNGEVPCPCCQ